MPRGGGGMGVGHKVWALPLGTRLISRVHRGATARPPGSSPSGTTTAGWRGSGISLASHPVSTGRLTPSIRDHPQATQHGCCPTSSDEPKTPVGGREGNIRCSLSLRPRYTVVGGESCRVSYEERGAISMQGRYPESGRIPLIRSHTNHIGVHPSRTPGAVPAARDQLRDLCGLDDQPSTTAHTPTEPGIRAHSRCERFFPGGLKCLCCGYG